MSLKEAYAKAREKGDAFPLRQALKKFDDGLSTFCDELDLHVQRLLSDTWHSQLRGEKTDVVYNIRCNNWSDASLTALTPHVKEIEALPAFKRLVELCANPARDACCIVRLCDSRPNSLWLAALEVRIDAEKTFNDSRFIICATEGGREIDGHPITRAPAGTPAPAASGAPKP
jgi:hypothetical protein